MLLMRDEMCCKSVGTDLSMLDIDDFITEISQLKKEVALLEAKLRSRGDEGVKKEDVDVACCESLVYVTDGCLDSVWMSRDQSRTPQPLLDSKLSEEKSRHTQDSELSLTLLCYTESKPTDAQDTVCDSNQGLQDEESTDQTSTESLDSVCIAGEQQQILQTTLKMCSVKLIDCTNLMMKIKTECVFLSFPIFSLKSAIVWMGGLIFLCILITSVARIHNVGGPRENQVGLNRKNICYQNIQTHNYTSFNISPLIKNKSLYGPYFNNLSAMCNKPIRVSSLIPFKSQLRWCHPEFPILAEFVN
ncbi:uncharacterized protein [Paramisgurnus dabryanus]|uniref:uncharacterized protein n=1 Tax=Paramisgurnus dabryanus TaxID=90735 RepID=UPI0031F46EFB